jgi:ascorbate-specific PTS system EIIC-type component UlaA
MLAWLVLEAFLDYNHKIDFRNVRWMVISYVVLFFAGSGGLLGVAANAGGGWRISAIILFIIMAALTFIQRAVTGI